MSCGAAGARLLQAWFVGIVVVASPAGLSALDGVPLPAAFRVEIDLETLPGPALPRPALTPSARSRPPANPGQGPGSDPPMVTDRPDFTESAVTVSRGRFQLEGGYTLEHSQGRNRHALGEILLRAGMAEGVELRVGLNSYVWSATASGAPTSGLEDASLGVKLHLLEGSAATVRPTVAVIVAATLPTGGRQTGEDDLQPEAKLALAWDLTDRLALGSNLNYAYLSAEGRRANQVAGSLALGFAATPRIGTYLEYFGFFPDSPGGPDRHLLNGGATLLLHPDLQLDGRLGVRLDDPDGEVFVGFGAAWRW